MPYAILKFKLPQERDEHQRALEGYDWVIACEEFDNWLRGEIKHGGRENLQEIRDKFWEVLRERNLNTNL